VDTTAPVVSAISTSQAFTKIRGRRTVDVTVNYLATDVTGLPVCALTVAPLAAPRKDKGRDKDDEITWQIVDAQHVQFAGKINDDEKTTKFAITIGCADGSGNASAATTTMVTLVTKDGEGSDGRDR
jgi:hypothetical protein